VRLLRGHQTLRRTLNAQLQGEHELAINDYEALLLLSRAEDRQLRRVDLSEGLQLTASGVTRLLDGLEERALVDKKSCASDARVTYAVLTDAGFEKLEQASCSHVAAIQAVFEERYTDDELLTMSELLGRLPGAAAADPEACTPG
jgi:DNA-binding MarR family transcriptional regulator